jgi:transcriptional regulator with XRE-family HTH domain
MTSQNFYWASNLKFLRNRKKISQEVMARALDMARSKLAMHESGAVKNPPLEDLIKISEHFKISIDTLLKIDLSRLGELKLRELEAGNDVYMTGSNLRILALTVDRNNRENVEYVPIKAKAGYRAGYSDPEYIAALPKYSLPELPRSGTFRMFPITGDSMLPIPDKSIVIGQYVEDWTNLKPDTACIVILKGEQDFVFKLVTIQADGVMLLKSLNRSYEPYTVKTEDVLEIWKYHKCQISELPEPQTDLQELKTMILDLKKQMQ